MLPPPRTASFSYRLAGPAARGAAQWTPVVAGTVYSCPRVRWQHGGRPMSGLFALLVTVS